MERTCTVCGESKPEANFYLQKSGYRMSRCDDCRRSKARDATRKYRYGISPEQYQIMLDSQNHSCAVCGVRFGEGANKANIDHDHACCSGNVSCGKCVRGIICSLCNTMAGAVENNLDHLEAMFRYLTFHLTKETRGYSLPQDEELLEFLYPGPDAELVSKIRNGRRNK